jgi:hypothetical protein
MNKLWITGLSKADNQTTGRLISLSIICLLFAPCAWSQKIKISSTRLLRVEQAEHSYSVFPETQNASVDNLDAPQRWQFVVEPMFIPMMRQTGSETQSIELQQQEFDRKIIPVIGGYQQTVRTRVTLPLMVKSDELLDAAAEALTEYYKDLHYTFERRQVSTVPVVEISLLFPDLASGPCKLVNPTIPVSGADKTVRVLFDCIDELKVSTNKPVTLSPSVEDFKKRLSLLNGEIEITYDAKTAEVAVVTVQTGDLRKTKLYADLKGEGNERFVSRDDMRQLGIDTASTLSLIYSGRKMSPDEVQGCFIQQLMSFPEVTIEAQAINREMLSKTYNGNDLDPDKINHTLDDRLDKSSSKDNVKFNGSGGGKALFGLAEANLSMSGETFAERMAEHGVKVEFNGEKWVAKGLIVKQVNLTDLSQKMARGCTVSTVGESAPLAKEKRQLRLQ